MPGHLGASGDGAVIRLAGVELHVHPDLSLRFCELLRGDPPHPVPGRLSLRVHLLDERLQLLFALLPGVGVDALGVLGAIRPGGGVAPLEEMVIELVDAPGAWLPGAPRRRLEGFLPGRFRVVFLHLVAEAAVDFGRGLTLHLAGDVGVDVQGRGRRHVPQHGGEGLDVHTVLQRHGSEGVPQVMEAHLLAPGPLQNAVEPSGRLARRERRILFHRGGEQPAGVRRLLVFPEHLHHGGRQHQLADGGPRLWDVQLYLSVHRVDLLVHRQRSGVQIQVGPLEGHQLPAATAGAQVQQEQFKISVRLGLEEKPPELTGREHLHLPAPLGRQLAARGRVGPDQVLLHRLVQRRTALGVAHPHHPVGEARAVELRPDQPPLFFQVGVELLKVLLRQLAQRDLPQLRDDMQVDGTLIGALRGGAEAGLDVVLIPEVHPLSEGHVGADLLRPRAAHFLQKLRELFLTRMLGLGQHVFRQGEALVVIAHHGPAFPAAVLALPYGAGSLLPFSCHGLNSSPSRFSRKPPTTSLAALCISGVTWV